MRFVQAARHGGSQSRVTRIVIHGTVSPCVEGGARAVARYFQSPNAGGSAHYVVDPAETVACVHETTVAYHAPPNTGTIGIELCDPQTGSSSRWQDGDHEAMLRRTAALVRQVAGRWDVPLRKLTVAQVKAGARGICGHVDVSKAFGQTDHSDPGAGFPWQHFMDLVLEIPTSSEPATSWTEDIVNNLPTLEVGADSYDVKTLRAALFVRGGLAPSSYSELGLKAWLELTVFNKPLLEDVKAFQKRRKLEPDGIVGPKTWAAALGVS